MRASNLERSSSDSLRGVSGIYSKLGPGETPKCLGGSGTTHKKGFFPKRLTKFSTNPKLWGLTGSK